MEWSAERIRDSRALFERRGVGIWLVNHQSTEDLVGFCRFLEITTVHSEPQLVCRLARPCAGSTIGTHRRPADFIGNVIKSPSTISGLKPATTYVFQARAVKKTGGYSDWSDSVTRVAV